MSSTACPIMHGLCSCSDLNEGKLASYFSYQRRSFFINAVNELMGISLLLLLLLVDILFELFRVKGNPELLR